MNRDYSIIQEKVVTSSTDSTWAQAFSTLHLFVVVSLAQEIFETPLTTLGKEVLEKLQREFFAIDDKNLSTIKQAIVNTVEIIPPEATCSLVLGTVIEGILYIVIAGQGRVLLRRSEKLGVIAHGKENSIEAFSGKLEHKDVIILETHGFSARIPESVYHSLQGVSSLLDISETLAPLAHAHPDGTEAAIIFEFQSHQEQLSVFEEQEDSSEEQVIPSSPTQGVIAKLTSLPHLKLKIPQFSLKLTKRTLIFALVIFLFLILIGGIVNENLGKQKKEQKAVLSQTLTPAQQKYDEGVGLASLNKPLALDNLYQAQDILEKALPQFPENSTERKQLEDLLEKVRAEIRNLGGGARPGQESLLLDPASQAIKSISFITYKGGSLLGVNRSTGEIAQIAANGSIEKTYDGKTKNIKGVIADEENIYLLSGTISQVGKNTSDQKTIVEDISSAKGIETFSGNLYVLTDDGINKYAAGSFSESSYMGGDAADSATSFAIDSSIWVAYSDGSVKKFTRGNEDDFSIKGLSKPIGSSNLIYTDIDYTNIYVLDKTNNRIVIIAKSGEFKQEVSSKMAKNATSFAVDEASKKVYLVSGNKLYSIGF